MICVIGFSAERLIAADDQDKGLLGDLESELLQDLDEPKKTEAKKLDQKKGVGEDLGSRGAAEENPLSRVMKRMTSWSGRSARLLCCERARRV